MSRRVEEARLNRALLLILIVPNKAGCTEQDANLSLNEEMKKFERAQTLRPAVALTRAHAHNFDSATTEEG